MQKQGSEKCKREIVKQLYGEVKILAEIQRTVNVKHERGHANHRKVQHERRATALFEQDENTDAKPDQTDDREKNDRGRPARKCVDVLEICVVVIIGEGVCGFLVEVCKRSAHTCVVQEDRNVRDRNDLLE